MTEVENRYYPGGLMRCCIESLLEHGPGEEGQAIPCKYHANDGPTMIWLHRAWRWMGPNDD